MSFEAFIKNNKINKVYSYKEMRDGSTIEFGWVESSGINIDEPIVLSYPSKSKKISDRDKEWSKDEGRTASTLSDYRKYFISITGSTPEDFISKWDDINLLEKHWKSKSPRYRDGEGKFLISLANLISNGSKFIHYGRIYKRVDNLLEK
jgi:hypothetical protein|tara:strand:- start:1778 stop:2224 length:447 start_codon:yes stop_codon:yes gene_type:complete